MTLEWEQVIVHSEDPAALGQWWATALGWVVVHSSEDEFEIRPAPDRLPGIDFVRLAESKKSKSRLHLDFRPDDQDAEVARLEAHGARRVDIGQANSRGSSWRTPRATSSASSGSGASKHSGRSGVPGPPRHTVLAVTCARGHTQQERYVT